jgi:hypothetical protein
VFKGPCGGGLEYLNSSTLAVSVAINISMKLCFVSVNGPREPYLLDEPRISRCPHKRLGVSSCTYAQSKTICNKTVAAQGNMTQDGCVEGHKMDVWRGTRWMCGGTQDGCVEGHKMDV